MSPKLGHYYIFKSQKFGEFISSLVVVVSSRFIRAVRDFPCSLIVYAANFLGIMLFNSTQSYEVFNGADVN